MVNKMKSPRRLIALAAFAIVAMSAFGFAAANTVDDSNAGDGVGDVSGGDVENIEYTLNGASQIIGVEFDYVADTDAPTNMQVTLVGPDVLSTSCNSALTHWTCTFAATDIGPVLELRVVSYD